MSETMAALILIVIFLIVNFGLLKYRKKIRIEEGPFYSLFDYNGELVVLPRYIGKKAAHLKQNEVGFIKSFLHAEDMYQKQAEYHGFKTTEEFIASHQGITEDELIFKKTGMSKDEYYAQKNDMAADEYEAVQKGIPIEEYRAKKYSGVVSKAVDVTKNMDSIQCFSCGCTVYESSEFCTDCGESVNLKAVNEQKKFCTECGNRIPVGNKFCSQCGHKTS